MDLITEGELNALIYDSQKDSNMDIDKTLSDKAQKNRLTKYNVKNLIKNVLMDKDVATMLKQTLNDDEYGNCLYEPKLTRAKIKEMLKNYPASVHQWSPYQQQSIISECRLLIEKEFPDDSEDEEYHPEKTLDEEDEFDDDDESKCIEINKSFGTEGEVGNDLEDNTSMIDINDKETIGMRTRSKFSLNDTPLEIIEQAFIPPDITEDMYDSACENDEWMEFLSEFTKPLEFVQNDDGEDDPEYNVLHDDDFTNVDKEEFRIDKSVKVTRKEYNDLMNELYEFTESYLEFNGSGVQESEITPIIENNNKNIVKDKNSSQIIPADISNCSNLKLNNIGSKNYGQISEIDNCSLQKNLTLQPSIIEQNVNTQPKINKNENFLPTSKPNITLENEQLEDKTCDNIIEKPNLISPCKIVTSQEFGMIPTQIILFKHQLTQHIQLLTQSYLLCTMANKLLCHCRKLINMLEVTRQFCKRKSYVPININTSLKFIQDWNERELNESDIDRDYVPLPTYVKEFMLFYDKPVFVFPQMLPSKTFRLKTMTHPIGLLEEMCLILKINYVYKNLKKSPVTRMKYKKHTLSDLMPIILKSVHRRWFSHRTLLSLKHHVTRRTNAFHSNVLKNFFEHGEIEKVIHVVDIGSIFEATCLYNCDIKNFPPSWKSLVKKIVKQQ